MFLPPQIVIMIYDNKMVSSILWKMGRIIRLLFLSQNVFSTS